MGKYALILFLFYGHFSLAQDNIYKKDNSKIFAKILEVTPQYIKYKLPPPHDTIIISIPKSEVAIIIYKSGYSEVFKTINKPPSTVMLDPVFLEKEAKRFRHEYLDSVKKAVKLNTKTITLRNKNYIYYNLFELIDQSCGFSYTRNILNNLFCIYVPVSVGIGVPYFTNGLLLENKREYKMDKKIFDAALGFNYYLHHFTYNSPYFGVMLRYAGYNGEFNWNARNNYFTLYKTYYYLTAGFRTRSTTHFTFMANIHLGLFQNNYINKHSIQHYDILSRYNDGSSVNLSVQLGYNF